ncbi:tyrosine-type recombinase/integrase [Pseudomonas koreensis]|nr:tyrosine-type recombinase/integrase [Pseudomonas koreensis]MCU0070648.1 tyrosine-type recombinase/integrase [Pseudomonas koreensis]
MDLANLTGQRAADVLKASTADMNNGFLMIGQGKTEKRLRIKLYAGDTEKDLCIFINGLLDRRAQAGVKTSILITNQAGLRMSYNMPRNRWDEARETAATKAAAAGDTALAGTIRKFQFRDIRPKTGSEIEDVKDASRLLGHSTEEMTKKVYRRAGEIVKPTK